MSWLNKNGLNHFFLLLKFIWDMTGKNMRTRSHKTLQSECVGAWVQIVKSILSYMQSKTRRDAKNISHCQF